MRSQTNDGSARGKHGTLPYTERNGKIKIKDKKHTISQTLRAVHSCSLATVPLPDDGREEAVSEPWAEAGVFHWWTPKPPSGWEEPALDSTIRQSQALLEGAINDRVLQQWASEEGLPHPT